VAGGVSEPPRGRLDVKLQLDGSHPCSGRYPNGTKSKHAPEAHAILHMSNMG